MHQQKDNQKRNMSVSVSGRKLPCQEGEACPYEYDLNPERDIEGMPFVDGDSRSCPVYGHICPHFMEDFDLTVEDLTRNASLHCSAVLLRMKALGKADEFLNETAVLAQKRKDERRKSGR